MLISFDNVSISCQNNDKLMVYNEDQSYTLYDYCSNKNINFNFGKFVLTRAKYILVRLQTSTSENLSVSINFILLDSNPIPELTSTVKQITSTTTTTTTTTTNKFNLQSNRKFFN